MPYFYKMSQTPTMRKGSMPSETRATRVRQTAETILVDLPVDMRVTPRSIYFASAPWVKRF